jgi:hypothetical protein
MNTFFEKEVAGMGVAGHKGSNIMTWASETG